MRANHEWYTDPRYAPKAEAAARRCDHAGCGGAGEHKAPRERGRDAQGPGDYFWFCLPHVQEYNKQWNYFSGMSDAEVDRFQREAVTGHRPTWRMGTFAGRNGASPERLEQKLFEFLHQRAPEGAEMPGADMALKPKYRHALKVLEVRWPISPEETKKAYKTLAKKLHPDLNPGDETAAERFKEVTHAYHLMMRAFEAAEV